MPWDYRAPKIFHNLNWVSTPVDLDGRTPRKVATLGLLFDGPGAVTSLGRAPCHGNAISRVGFIHWFWEWDFKRWSKTPHCLAIWIEDKTQVLTMVAATFHYRSSYSAQILAVISVRINDLLSYRFPQLCRLLWPSRNILDFLNKDRYITAVG